MTQPAVLARTTTDPAAPARIDFARYRTDEALLVAVVRKHFPSLVRRGSRYGCPPGSDGDSVSVYYGDGGWFFHRFSTGQHGDVLDVVQWYEGAETVREAVALLDGGVSPFSPGQRGDSVPHYQRKPYTPPGWLHRVDALIARYAAHPDRYRLWYAYKALRPATVDRWRLGVGVLPSTWCRQERLIYPVVVDGATVGLRGRAVTPHACPNNDGVMAECPSWLSAGGSQAALWGWDLLAPAVCPPGRNIVVDENPVDAMLTMQIEPSVVALAGTGGAGTWRPEWTLRIAATRPAQIVIWYDNDLAGAPNAETYAAEAARWQARHPDIARVPEPAGPKRVREFRALAPQYGGYLVDVYDWPAGTPLHYDAGAHLSAFVRAA